MPRADELWREIENEAERLYKEYLPTPDLRIGDKKKQIIQTLMTVFDKHGSNVETCLSPIIAAIDRYHAAIINAKCDSTEKRRACDALLHLKQFIERQSALLEIDIATSQILLGESQSNPELPSESA